MSAQQPSDNSSKERHKTYRLAMVLGVSVLLAVLGMNVVQKGTSEGGRGSVDVDITKGKFRLTLDRPVVDQIGVRRTTAAGGTGAAAEFTQGKIEEESQVDAVAELDATPTAFAGKNFINKEAGFLFSVNHPEIWQIRHNPMGMHQPLIPVNTIHDPQGTHLNVTMESVPAGTTIRGYVQNAVQLLMASGMITQPEISYDDSSQTAFVVITNGMTGGQSYMKLVLETGASRIYAATANYNVNISNPTSLQDLRTMVTTFTVLAKS